MDLGTVMEQHNAKSKKQKGAVVQVCWMQAAPLPRLPMRHIAVFRNHVGILQL